MNLISLLGMLTLLALAWAMSYHRTKVNLRPVFWGLGLQFVLALTILRQDYWSWVGMALLGLLIVTYMLTGRGGEEHDWTRVLTVSLIALAVGAALTRLPATILVWLPLVLVVLMLVNAKVGFQRAVQPYLGALLVISGIAWVVASDLHGREFFDALSSKVAYFLSLSDYGSTFLFGNLVDDSLFFPPEGSPWPGFGMQFAFKVLPTIIFFGGFMAVLYYLGAMQRVVDTMSHFMRWTIGTSGSETLSCSANIFIGQTEAPLLIRPFLTGMTRSELLTIMVGGFATIAGGVLAGYIAFGVPAGHLIAASVMSAPAALVVGKIIYPELEHSETAGDVKMPEIPSGDNVIEAASNGIVDGLKLAVNVGAMLIGFIALIAVVDVILGFFDGLIDGRLLGGALRQYDAVGLSPITQEFVGIFPGSLQTFFGTLLRPLAYVMGVPWEDAAAVGNLLGVKLSLNEFVSYGTLGTYISTGQIGERAVIISTYALLKAMFGGALASWLTATIAGMLI
jgi:CNT family concentrative nucleoside transporter